MAGAAAGTIHFELVSPERKLISEPVKMAVVPSAEGDIGAMAGHMSVLASLRPGVIALYRDGAEVEKIFVGGGFADVTAEICTVLAEDAVNVNDLNREEIEQQIRDLNEDLGMAADDQARARVKKALVLAEAKLAAIAA